jgi:3-isopropylmalate dehydratase small subunit
MICEIIVFLNQIWHIQILKLLIMFGRSFAEVYFNDVTNAINERVLQIHQAYHHRLFNKTTETSLKFKNNFLQQVCYFTI